jgi:hypothetical protein
MSDSHDHDDEQTEKRITNPRRSDAPDGPHTRLANAEKQARLVADSSDLSQSQRNAASSLADLVRELRLGIVAQQSGETPTPTDLLRNDHVHHDCPESAADAVVVQAGEDCPICGGEILELATDGESGVYNRSLSPDSEQPEGGESSAE